MARARIIKPGFFLNERLADLHPLTRILFAGLWCNADRLGRLEDRPKKIKAAILPYDGHDIDKALDDLQAGGFISRYRNCEASYIQVLAFTKHQHPHAREVESDIPEHDLGDAKAQPRHGLGTAKAMPRHDLGDVEPGLLQTHHKNLTSKDSSQKSKVGGKGGGSKGGAMGEGNAILSPPSRRTLPAAPPEGTPGFLKNGLKDIEGLNSTAFAEWDCERRRRGGKSNSSWTDAAKLKAAKLLASESLEDQQAMVDASIAAGWQGLFRPGKGKPKKFNPGEYMLDKVRKQYENKEN